MSRENIPFIKSEVEVTHFTEGSFVKVSKLNLAPEVREKIGDKYGVAKEYITPYHPLLTDKHNEYTVFEVAFLLKRRQSFVKHYFQSLPNFVVQSEYIVGGEKDNPKLYEFQKFIEYKMSLNDLYCSNPQWVLELAAYIAPKFTLESLQNLNKELNIFYDLFKKMIDWEPVSYDDQEFREFAHKVIDLKGEDNIFITEDGSLRLVDTNILFGRDIIMSGSIGSYTGKDLYNFPLQKVCGVKDTVREALSLKIKALG